MIFFIVFTVEMIFLFFLSKKLITSLSRTLFAVTRNHKVVINILSILFLPGTILHELSHLLTAGILLVPIGEMNVLPEIEGESVKLGSVQIGKVDPFRLTLVGVAPVIWGSLTILMIIYLAQILNFNWWQTALGLYLIFNIANSMFSSKKDIQGTIGFVVAILAITVALLLTFYFLNPSLLATFWIYLTNLNLTPLVEFFKLASFYLLIPLLLDLLVIFLTSMFVKRHLTNT
ncbi:hypothetical protein A3J13_01175 [Candidatus Daviesbacteria bacterium RIFCSPLOWO2_02_FULL_36_8]|uniref:Uncharacterized protein n=1 Tax=Candidatus Daviesbacteria bacterium RIFCSPLOWO2_02_FULL_36_8 TaxID=1797793 RepID=A0A1F5MFY3_9BACT|nr:MAG: hypothetical protein A3J13_01175 [Candidatus Daviesbacteria bacterium RIFCSPLOWO2_02_FULL_36_8]